MFPAAATALASSFPLEKGRSIISPKLFGAFCMVCLGVAVLHPNGIFTLYVVACAYLVARVIPHYRSSINLIDLRPRWKYTVFQIIVIFMMVVLWLIALNLPFMLGTTTFIWGWTIPLPDALLNCFDFGLTFASPLGTPQLLYAAIVWIGTAWGIHDKRTTWVALAFLLFDIIYIGSASVFPEMKRIFSGFWYTDPERTAALVALTSIPLPQKDSL